MPTSRIPFLLAALPLCSIGVAQSPVLLGVAESTPGAGVLATSDADFQPGDTLRWNFDATSGVQAGQLCAVAINLGPSGMPVGVTPQIPGYQQLWAGSSPTGFAAVAPPHVIGFGDHQLHVPPGILLLLDEFRIQGLVLDAVNAPGSLPVVPTANAITFTYLP